MLLPSSVFRVPWDWAQVKRDTLGLTLLLSQLYFFDVTLGEGHLVGHSRCMKLGGQARDFAWSLVVRSGYVAFPRAQLAYGQRAVTKYPELVGRSSIESHSGSGARFEDRLQYGAVTGDLDRSFPSVSYLDNCEAKPKPREHGDGMDPRSWTFS